MIETVYHEIKDNALKINNDNYTWINGQKIIVGVENENETQILTDENGYHYSRTAVEAQEVYNKSTQHRSCWFLLDLETGVNPHRYFPGCEIHGMITGDDIEVKAEASETSETITTISKAIVVITNIDSYDEVPSNDYYKIKYSDIEGYVHKSYISDVVYAEPF